MKKSEINNFLKLIDEEFKNKQRFIETNVLEDALQNLQNQVYNLTQTYKGIIIDNYLLMSEKLEESDKNELSENIKTLQNDFNNVLRAMSTVYRLLKNNNPKNDKIFKIFVDKQSQEILELYNDSIENSINKKLTKLSQYL